MCIFVWQRIVQDNNLTPLDHRLAVWNRRNSLISMHIYVCMLVRYLHCMSMRIPLTCTHKWTCMCPILSCPHLCHRFLCPPQWLKLSPEEVKEQIYKLAKKGLNPSQIGVVLRDSYGVAQVKNVTGNKILRILKSKGAVNVLCIMYM